MSLRLVKAGYPVRAFDMNPVALARCVKAGTEAAASAVDAAAGADIIIMLLEDLRAKDFDLGKERLIDALVSGGTAGAVNGALALMVGGDIDAFKRCHPVFDAMGKSIFHTGAIGAGQSVKICNNMLAAVLMAGFSYA